MKRLITPAAIAAPLALIAGAAEAHTGVGLPVVELIIVASVVVLGALVAARVPAVRAAGGATAAAGVLPLVAV